MSGPAVSEVKDYAEIQSLFRQAIYNRGPEWFAEIGTKYHALCKEQLSEVQKCGACAPGVCAGKCKPSQEKQKCDTCASDVCTSNCTSCREPPKQEVSTEDWD